MLRIDHVALDLTEVDEILVELGDDLWVVRFRIGASCCPGDTSREGRSQYRIGRGMSVGGKSVPERSMNHLGLMIPSTIVAYPPSA